MPIRLFQRVRTLFLQQAWLLIALIALADWKVDNRVPLGWLYLLPVSLAAARLGRAGLIGVALVCTVLAEFFDGIQWQLESGLPRGVLYFSAFAGTGLFVHQALTSRRAAAAHMAAAAVHMTELETEVKARREAEEQLNILIESTPVAVFTADAAGIILLANDAADRLFALGPGELTGRSVTEFIPPLLDVPALKSGGAQPSFRTVMQCRGRRANGEIFQADVWFSTYQTSTGPRLAALVVDTSEELRDREESSLDQLLAGSRILVGAVSHEVRNVCAAINVVYANLVRADTRAESRTDARSGTLATNKDFEALGTLVVALERIASMELSQAANQLSYINLHALLEEVLIVIAPALREQEITLVWQVNPALPLVWADRQSLMQVFLNLVKNSERAMESIASTEATGTMETLEASNNRILTIATSLAPDLASPRVQIRVSDTGTGVRHPELLFKPFQQQASATGLGLYLSRAMMRSFSGELRYEGTNGAHSEAMTSSPEHAPGACFVVELAALPPGTAQGTSQAPAGSLA